jgi:hypothetical protein
VTRALTSRWFRLTTASPFVRGTAAALGVIGTEMRYGSTSEATSFAVPALGDRLVRAALWFIPRANPDFEAMFPLVRQWMLEIDETGHPRREIALNADGVPLFAAPNNRNCGFWTDSDKTFSDAELSPVDASQFEEMWSRACSRSGTPNKAFKRRRARTHAP